MIHTSDMTHSYVWHDSFICVTWLIHTCDMTHSHVWFLLVHVNSLKHFVDHSTETSRYEALCDMINSLQHAATRCNTLLHTATHCNTLQHTATHCNTLQHTATHTLLTILLKRHAMKPCMIWLIHMCDMTHSLHCGTLQNTATYCKTIQYTATHYIKLFVHHSTEMPRYEALCNMTHCLHLTATHCNILQQTGRHWKILQHTATHCNTLQHTVTYCNALQHTPFNWHATL